MILGGYTATGPRDANEDNYYVVDFSEVRSFTNGIASFVMVSDGMGGYQGGDIASGLAVSSAENYISQLLEMAEGNQIEFDAAYALGEISQNAHDAILAETAARGNSNMGATFIGAFLSPTHAWIGHVGDSRAYLIQNGVATQLTEDHSQVGRMLSRGLITEEEAQNHPARNRIERALGFSDATPDITEVDLQPGDALLLCSDGVYTVLGCQALADCVMKAKDAEGAATRVVKSALRQGTDDNSTAVVALNVQGVQAEPRKRKPAPTIRTSAVSEPKHGSPEQYRAQGLQDSHAVSGQSVQHSTQPQVDAPVAQGAADPHLQQAATDQYRLENYRGRSSLGQREAKPRVTPRQGKPRQVSGPSKSMVIPIAVGAVLVVAVIIIFMLATGGAGGGGEVGGGQQATTAPAEATQQNGGAPAAGDSSSAGATDNATAQTSSASVDYTVGQGATLKYIDESGTAHTFDESESDGLNVQVRVVLGAGELVKADETALSYGQEGKKYYALIDAFKNDLMDDYALCKAGKTEFTSELSKKVSDAQAYLNFLQALEQHDIDAAARGTALTTENAVARLAVDEAALTPVSQ